MRHVIPVRTLTPQCERLQVGTSAEQHRRHVLVVPKGASFSDTTRPCRRLTGTLYGHRRGRVVLVLQETPQQEVEKSIEGSTDVAQGILGYHSSLVVSIFCTRVLLLVVEYSVLTVFC